MRNAKTEDAKRHKKDTKIQRIVQGGFEVQRGRKSKEMNVKCVRKMQVSLPCTASLSATWWKKRGIFVVASWHRRTLHIAISSSTIS